MQSSTFFAGSKKNADKEMYNVNNYSDAELFEMLDLMNPSDRELEAKILMMLDKYSDKNEKDPQFYTFFENIYNRFFETADQEEEEEEEEEEEYSYQEEEQTMVEGFASKGNPKKSTDKNGENNNNGNNGKISVGEKRSVSQTKTFEYIPGKLNPLLKETQKRVIHLDSRHRDILTNPYTTDYTMNLSDPLLDAVSLRLQSVSIPYSWYNINTNGNVFYLVGNTPGIKGVYSFKFTVPIGTYEIAGLIIAVNYAIQEVAKEYPEVNFGTTHFDCSLITNMSKFTFDIQNVYTEASYYLQFPNWTNPFGDTASRLQTIPGFLGFLDTIYSLSAIYSNFQYALLATGATNQPSPGFIPTEKFAILVDGTILSNNYFTIYSYIPEPTVQDPSNITIIEEIRVSFFTKSGLYSRQNIVSNVNQALKTNPKLTSDSVIQDVNVYYIDASGNSIYFQRYELNITLNRKTTKNVPGMKSMVIFPGDSKVWLGPSSCFLFDQSPTAQLDQLNSIRSETSPVQTYYPINTSPYILLSCFKPYYTSNIFQLNIPNAENVGYPEGYTLTNYVGVKDLMGGGDYQTSTVNLALAKQLNALFPMPKNNATIEMFYDLEDNRVHTTVNISQIFDQTDYVLDLSQCILSTIFQLPSTIDIFYDPSSATLNDIFDSSFALLSEYIIDDTNNKIIVTPKLTSENSDVPPYTVVLPTGTFVTLDSVQRVINQAFLSIQGIMDKTGVQLNGLNMSQTKLSFSYPLSGVPSPIIACTFSLNIKTQLTELDYEIGFFDEIPAPTTPTTPTTSSWAQYLGIMDASYILQNVVQGANTLDKNYTEIIAENTANEQYITITAANQSFSFFPLTGVVGLYTDTSANDVVITVPLGSYTKYELYTEINAQFANNRWTRGSAITYIQEYGIEYVLLRMDINRIYTAADYNLTFFDIENVEVYQANMNGVLSFKNATWDIMMGWLLGYRNSPIYNLSPANPLNPLYVNNNAYTIDMSNGIITLEGNTSTNIHIFNNLYIILDDYTQHQLNDGLITGARAALDIKLPSYTNKKLNRKDPAGNQIISFENLDNPNSVITAKQLTSSSQIALNGITKPKFFSDPPYVKDMFALVPLKLQGLRPGQFFTEYGGTLQDNDRKYFGPVNIRRVNVKLINEHGDVLNLNNANWSFSLICEYLYTVSTKK